MVLNDLGNVDDVCSEHEGALGELDVEMDARMGVPEGRTDKMPNQSTPKYVQENLN
jgi:hypothetical protein